LLVAGLALVSSSAAGVRRADQPTCAPILHVHPSAPPILGGWDDVRFSELLLVDGGSGKYFWQVTSGSFPPGIEPDFPKPPSPGAKYDRAGGPQQHVQGMPTKHGAWPFGIAVYDWPDFPAGLSCEAGATASYTILIASRKDYKAAFRLLVDAGVDLSSASDHGRHKAKALQKYRDAEKSVTSAIAHIAVLQADDPGDYLLGVAAKDATEAHSELGRLSAGEAVSDTEYATLEHRLSEAHRYLPRYHPDTRGQ
jgi:hypothetical protein